MYHNERSSLVNVLMGRYTVGKNVKCLLFYHHPISIVQLTLQQDIGTLDTSPC